METVADLTIMHLRQERAADFARWGLALAVAQGDTVHAAKMFASRWPKSKNIDAISKAAIAPGRVDGSSWGDELSPLAPLGSAFIELIRPRTVLGRLQGVRRVPFRVRFPVQTAGALVGWAGEGCPTQVSALAFTSATFPSAKIAGIVVVSAELGRSSDPAAEMLVRNDLIQTVSAFSDQAFLDPTKAAVADVSPASITYGATTVAASGSTAAAFHADAAALILAMQAAGGQFATPYWTMKPAQAAGLALLGVDENLKITGGTLLGIPVLTSTAAGDQITLIDASEVLVADDGADLDASGQAAIQLDSAPTDPPAATTVMTSLWQMNLLGIMARRYIYWQRRSAGSVGYISGAEYGLEPEA